MWSTRLGLPTDFGLGTAATRPWCSRVACTEYPELSTLLCPRLAYTLQKELQAEAMTLSRLRHPCCVTFYGICELPPAILTGGHCCQCTAAVHRDMHGMPTAWCHVTMHTAWCKRPSPPFSIAAAEYCSRGSLYDVLQAAQRQPAVAAQLTWQRRLLLAYDAAAGLNYLHNRSPPILHRDGKQAALAQRRWLLRLRIKRCAAPLPTCPRTGQLTHPACRPPAVKSPNLLVDTHWRCKVAGEWPAKYRSWLACAPGSLPACFTIQIYLLWQHLMRPLPQSPLFEDFNLSKILAGGQQPVASSGGAPLNPTCKWLAGRRLVQAAGRGWLPRAADRSQASPPRLPTT